MRLDARILVVDDEAAQRELLAGFLRDLEAEVVEAADGRAALDLARRCLPDVVLSDVRMPGLGGRELLVALKRENPEVEVVLVTAYATVPEAVACLKEGAADYLLKPLELDEVELLLRRAVERRHLRRENRELRRRVGEIESLPGIVTAGGPMAEALSTVGRAAASDVSVVLSGETGAGKELVARAIHALAPRGGPFSGNCWASPQTCSRASSSATRSARSPTPSRPPAALRAGERRHLVPRRDWGAVAQAPGQALPGPGGGDYSQPGRTRDMSVDFRLISATHRDLPRRGKPAHPRRPLLPARPGGESAGSRRCASAARTSRSWSSTSGASTRHRASRRSASRARRWTCSSATTTRATSASSRTSCSAAWSWRAAS